MKIGLVLLLLVALTYGARPSTKPDCSHCLQQYEDCLTKNGCSNQGKEYFIKHCKRLYNECIAFCVKMLEKIQKDDFDDKWWKVPK